MKQHGPPRHVVAHLSDPHLLAGGVLQYDAVDTEAGLRLALARLAAADPPPQALVFTGDLADKAQPLAYARLREIVEPTAAAMGAEVVWVMGNHDERADYALSLFGEASDAPQDRVHEVNGLRIVSLDSSVPGYHHGELSEDQLAWLAGVLATPAGTALCSPCTTRPSRYRCWEPPSSSSCASRTGSPPSSRAPTCAGSWRGTSTSRRTRSSRASPSRSRRPALHE